MRVLALLLTLLPFASALAEPVKFPKFSDYPVRRIDNGPPGTVKPDADLKRWFGTRIRNAMKEPVNFGGRYVITTWGCRTGCINGAVVDKITGNAFELPQRGTGTILSGGTREAVEDGTFYDVDFRPDSMLFAAGDRSYQVGSLDQPRTWHFYEMTASGLKLISSYVVPELANPPQPADFAVKTLYRGPVARPVLDNEAKQSAAAHLKATSVNFACRYAIAFWRTSAPEDEAVDFDKAATVNLATGEIVLMPDDAYGDLFKPRFSPDSALLELEWDNDHCIDGTVVLKTSYHVLTGREMRTIGTVKRGERPCDR